MHHGAVDPDWVPPSAHAAPSSCMASPGVHGYARRTATDKRRLPRERVSAASRPGRL
jgi:hypothetical protein